jgi:DNA-binding CsgD family transcriptional regulator
MNEETVQLSDREQEILAHIANGATNQQIANTLGISINTVKVHVRNIFGKIGVSSRTEATLYAVRNRIVQVGPEDTSLVAEPTPTPDATPTLPEPLSDPSPPQSTSLPAAQTAGEQPAPAQSSDSASNSAPPSRATPRATQTASGINQRLLLYAGAILIGIAALIGSLVVLFPTLAQTPTTPSSPQTDSTTSETPSPQTTQALSNSQISAVWSPLNALPTVQTAAAAVSLEGSIFLIGGETPTGKTGAVWRYAPGNNTWRSLTSKPTPVSNAQAVALNGRIYIPGGETSNERITARVEVYDPVQGNWTTAAPIPDPRSGYSLVALEGRMYLFGGWDGTTYRAEVYVYDPDTDMWDEETMMPTARAYGGAVSVDTKIYIMGGENDSGLLASSEIYTPARNGGQWTASAALLPEPRSHFGSGAIANFIVLLGGVPETAPVYYNIRTDTWQTFRGPEFLPDPDNLGMQPAVAQRDTSLFVVNHYAEVDQSTNYLLELRLLYTIIVPSSP